MGYTHYWNFEEIPSKQKFAEFTEGVKQLTATANEAGIPIGEEKYESDFLTFNGVGDGAHESFYVELNREDNFCKTAFKPYDTAVTASLILAKKIFGSDFQLTSDGNWNDWESGRLLYESVFNIEPQVESFPTLKV